jgi:hypothetical protein
MTLEEWRKINYLTADINTYVLGIISIFILYNLNKIDARYKSISVYLFISLVIEVLSKVFIIFNKPDTYHSWLNHILYITEIICLTYFLKSILKTHVFRIIFWLIVSSIFSYKIYQIFTDPHQDTKFSSALLSIGFLINCGMSMYEISKNDFRNRLFKNTDAIIIISFFIAYLILIIVFLTLPSIVEYSRILGNQVVIFRNIISILFYVFIGVAFFQKIRLFKPTAIPKP